MNVWRFTCISCILFLFRSIKHTLSFARFPLFGAFEVDGSGEGLGDSWELADPALEGCDLRVASSRDSRPFDVYCSPDFVFVGFCGEVTVSVMSSALIKFRVWLKWFKIVFYHVSSVIDAEVENLTNKWFCSTVVFYILVVGRHIVTLI